MDDLHHDVSPGMAPSCAAFNRAEFQATASYLLDARKFFTDSVTGRLHVLKESSRSPVISRFGHRYGIFLEIPHKGIHGLCYCMSEEAINEIDDERIQNAIRERFNWVRFSGKKFPEMLKARYQPVVRLKKFDPNEEKRMSNKTGSCYNDTENTKEADEDSSWEKSSPKEVIIISSDDDDEFSDEDSSYEIITLSSDDDYKLSSVGDLSDDSGDSQSKFNPKVLHRNLPRRCNLQNHEAPLAAKNKNHKETRGSRLTTSDMADSLPQQMGRGLDPSLSSSSGEDKNGRIGSLSSSRTIDVTPSVETLFMVEDKSSVRMSRELLDLSSYQMNSLSGNGLEISDENNRCPTNVSTEFDSSLVDDGLIVDSYTRKELTGKRVSFSTEDQCIMKNCGAKQVKEEQDEHKSFEQASSTKFKCSENCLYGSGDPGNHVVCRNIVFVKGVPHYKFEVREAKRSKQLMFDVRDVQQRIKSILSESSKSCAIISTKKRCAEDTSNKGCLKKRKTLQETVNTVKSRIESVSTPKSRICHFKLPKQKISYKRLSGNHKEDFEDSRSLSSNDKEHSEVEVVIPEIIKRKHYTIRLYQGYDRELMKKLLQQRKAKGVIMWWCLLCTAQFTSQLYFSRHCHCKNHFKNVRRYLQCYIAKHKLGCTLTEEEVTMVKMEMISPKDISSQSWHQARQGKQKLYRPSVNIILDKINMPQFVPIAGSLGSDSYGAEQEETPKTSFHPLLDVSNSEEFCSDQISAHCKTATGDWKPADNLADTQEFLPILEDVLNESRNDTTDRVDMSKISNSGVGCRLGDNMYYHTPPLIPIDLGESIAENNRNVSDPPVRDVNSFVSEQDFDVSLFEDSHQRSHMTYYPHPLLNLSKELYEDQNEFFQQERSVVQDSDIVIPHELYHLKDGIGYVDLDRPQLDDINCGLRNIREVVGSGVEVSVNSENQETEPLVIEKFSVVLDELLSDKMINNNNTIDHSLTECERDPIIVKQNSQSLVDKITTSDQIKDEIECERDPIIVKQNSQSPVDKITTSDQIKDETDVTYGSTLMSISDEIFYAICENELN